jgi:type II secretory pathway component PulL
MGNSQLAGRLTLLVAVFAGLFLIFCGTTWYTIDQVRVQGKIYDQIVTGKDLIADILPPPEYIIESYLVARQLNDETERPGSAN